ncbi:MAG TPA: DMT family transporter [Planctomycetaceae bacterium]|nr:DMT family transporter [Planctomycetaceae bacterium]
MADIPLTDRNPPLGPTAIALCLLTAALWGGTPVAISFSVDELPPVAVAAIRFAMAAGFMLVWCRWEGSRLALPAGQRWLAFAGGGLLFFQIWFFNLGVAWSNSSHGSVLINTFVLWVVAIEHFITAESRLTATKAGGLAAAAAGGLILILLAERPAGGTSALDEPTLAGDLVLLASAAILGVKIVFTRHAVRKIPPSAFIFWHDVVGVALFAAWSLAFEDVTLRTLEPSTVLGLLYQGLVVAGFCFAVQAMLLRRHSASQISIFSTATPLFGIVLAALFRGDRLSPWLLASGVCVAGGILLVNVSREGDQPFRRIPPSQPL